MTDEKTQRLNVQKVIYENRVNVALEQAEEDPVTVKFRKDLAGGFEIQIDTVAKEGTIEDLLVFVKARKNPSLIMEVAQLLAQKSVANYVDFEVWLIWAGTQGGQAALDKLEVDGIFRLTNPGLTDFFADYSNLLIEDLDEYSSEWLSSQIVQGKERGLTPQEIANGIADQSDQFSQMRAERVVMTELAHAMTTVELETARRLEIEEKIWRTSQDELVCPICLPLDGRRININKRFRAVTPKNKVSLVQGPPAHPNCRCFIEEVIPKAWEIDDVWLGN